MRAFLIALLSLLLLPLAALAQQGDRPNTILVLDASGSMWGQIDGVNKVVIAREVIAELLADLPDDASLGLTVYGHRERGSCTDIETIVAPGPFTQDRILEAVNSINPRGRTPMTDAVVAAAQSLRYTEEAATVILVSDGIENCNPDPCAMARALEEAGVAFTAHVIGFDVASEPEARAQMQCIAEGTGGLFLTADNAAELSSALQQVVQAPAPVSVQLQAVVVPGNTPPTRPVTWTILTADGAVLSDGTQGAAIAADLLPGAYIARATRAEPAGPVPYQAGFTVVPGGIAPVVVPMPEIVETVPVTFTARVEPDMSVPASPLDWTLTDAAGNVLLGPVQAPGGNVQLLPGDYRLSVLRVAQGTTHEARFTVVSGQPQEVVIPLPALLVDVTFTARLDSADGPLITDPVLWEVTPLAPAGEIAPANPAQVALTRGAYRVTGYWTAREVEQAADFVIVDQPREIVLVFEAPLPAASLTAPATAVAGATIEVGWTGPGDPRDYIGVGTPEATGSARWDNYTYTREPSPLMLEMPMQPGPHLIRYFSSDGAEVLAEVPITVTPVSATLTAPATAVAGSTIEVGWTGPDYRQDYIGIGLTTAERSDRWENYTYTREGNPLLLEVPVTPGDYLIRYIANQDQTVIAELPITVTPVTATLTGPATAAAGSTIEVGWTGPGYPQDFIGIGLATAERSDRWDNYTYTREGNPLRLEVPPAPGDYVIRYVVNQDNTVIAELPITVTAASASLTAPATAVAGSTIEVGWTGPDAPQDYIGIGLVGAEGGRRWENYTYTRDGSPLRLAVPVTPGDYLITYFLNQDATPLAQVPITVTAVGASITAPASAVAGAMVEVGWTGPGYDGDFLGVGRVDATDGAQWETYTYTREGNPLRLEMPTEPGDYLIRYIVGQDYTAIAQTPITVTAVGATITAPARAAAGSTIEVGWTGPGYDGDFLGIGLADGSDGGWVAYTYTRDGNPAQLTLPETPGAYAIRYFLGTDYSAIAEVPITLE
ncbi:VWA domain-containing protein [Roseicyclus persicicus]|uniref:VWA domain-containing protein n=1 Tax=Roseicyclus persicicus TaxID=2650661 RepID=A0A7X6H406_9RHOB|nr:VWA domain-containing protein [Roseibacterium persicicum]NKX46402.1 VWA domain-containing protein [Roseibacterium persicicum]